MFVIVRHGNTFEKSETPRRIGARTDLPLTARGQEQARALGAFFAAKGWRFDRALISPLARTRQTAEAILAAQDQPVETASAEFLREVDYGPDEGKIEEEVLARIGQRALEAWEKTAAPPPGWIIAPEQRIAAWRALFASEEARTGTTLLVTSNGAARFALLAQDDLAAQAERLGSLKLPTGGFGVIARDQKGGWRLREWGVRP